MLKFSPICGIAVLFLVLISTSACRSTQSKSNDSTVQNEETREDIADGAREIRDNTTEAVSETLRGADILRRKNWLKKITSTGFPANSFNCPIRPHDPCAMVNILIEMSHPGQVGQVGHTGIAISDVKPGQSTRLSARNDLYYDFGPGEKLREKNQTDDPSRLERIGEWIDERNPGLFVECEGRPWWDHPNHFPGKTSAEIGFKDILENLDDVAGDHTVFRIPLCVSKLHARAIIDHWEQEIYRENMPNYKVPGLHCTSSVARSFEHTHPGLSEKVVIATTPRLACLGWGQCPT